MIMQIMGHLAVVDPRGCKLCNDHPCGASETRCMVYWVHLKQCTLTVVHFEQ